MHHKKRAIQKIAKYLNVSFSSIERFLKGYSTKAMFDVKLTEDIDTFAQALVLRDWWYHDIDGIFYHAAHDEILKSSEPTYSGSDVRRSHAGNVLTFRKAYFPVDRKVIVLKFSSTNLGLPGEDNIQRGMVLVAYRPSQEKSKKLKKYRYFDNERVIGFHCGYWDTVEGKKDDY